MRLGGILWCLNEAEGGGGGGGGESILQCLNNVRFVMMTFALDLTRCRSSCPQISCSVQFLILEMYIFLSINKVFKLGDQTP